MIDPIIRVTSFTPRWGQFPPYQSSVSSIVSWNVCKSQWNYWSVWVFLLISTSHRFNRSRAVPLSQGNQRRHHFSNYFITAKEAGASERHKFSFYCARLRFQNLFHSRMNHVWNQTFLQNETLETLFCFDQSSSSVFSVFKLKKCYFIKLYVTLYICVCVCLFWKPFSAMSNTLKMPKSAFWALLKYLICFVEQQNHRVFQNSWVSTNVFFL